MADGSVIIKVEMETGGVRAGVGDIKAGCERAAAAAERTGRSMTRAMADGARAAAACGENAKRTGGLVWASCGQVRDGMSAMTAENGRAREALEQMQAGLSGVRAGLATAFAPIVTAAAPLLIKLSELASKAANAVAAFFSVLTGKNTYKKAAAAQNAVTKSVAGTGKAAKEAAKNLSGLDELNIWKENKVVSGGGGAGADLDMEEIEAGEATDFVVRLRDILFQWDDLNPELIAEKILTSLCAAAGGIIGYSLGGPVGGLVGLTMGALLGVKLSQVLFDGDGTLNKGEIVKLILTALGGLIGGALGFAIGGPLGAAIGFTVGAGISVALSGAVIEKGTQLWNWVKENVWEPVQNAIVSFGEAVVEFGAKVKNDAATWWKNVKKWWSKKVGSVKEFTTSVTNQASTWWSNVKSWWGKKVGAAKEFTTSVTNQATTWWSNVKTWWSGKVGAAKEFTTSVTNQASTWWASVKNWWSGKVGAAKEFTTSVTNQATTWWSNVKTWWSGTVGSVQNFTTSVTNQASTWWSSVKNWWSGTVGSVKEFTTSVTNQASTWWASVKNWWSGTVGSVKNFTTSVTNQATTWWSNVKTWWSGKVGAVKNFTTSVSNTASTWWANVKSWWNEKSSGGVTFTAKITSFTDALKNKTLEFKAKITSFVDAIQSKVLNFTAKIGNFLGLGGSSSGSSSAYSGAGRKATGGIYKNGRWYPVEGYASGGNPRSGRLFIANENGMPELVGTIGGHTAVMNNGQIVSSVAAGVYRAVAAAMGQVGGWFRAMSGALADIPPAIELLANMPARVPQPVLAAGTVLPPKAVYADGPVQGLADAVSGLRSALERQGQGQGAVRQEPAYNVNLNVDGRTLLQVILSQGRVRMMQSGGNPFTDLMGG